MARSRKTRKTVSDPEPEVVETEEEEEEEEETEEAPVTKKSPVKKAFKEEPKEFTAILQNATSLTLMGKKFLKNQPTKVPLEHLKLFRDHGWFRVIV